MPHRRRRTLALMLSLAIAATAAVAADRQSSLPSGRDLLAKNLQALGGAAAHQALKSVRARGTLAIPSQNITGQFEALSMRPDKLITRVTIPGIGAVVSAYNGTIGWTLSPIAGPSLLQGRELQEAIDDAQFDSSLFLPQFVKEATTMARKDFDGHPAFVVKVVYASGRDETHYFDADNGLELGMEAERASPQGILPTVHILRDYKKFGNVLVATTQVERALGLETVTTIATIEFDVVEAAAFEPPAEIKALIK